MEPKTPKTYAEQIAALRDKGCAINDENADMNEQTLFKQMYMLKLLYSNNRSDWNDSIIKPIARYFSVNILEQGTSLRKTRLPMGEVIMPHPMLCFSTLSNNKYLTCKDCSYAL